MTKSLFIKLAECLECVWSLSACMCVGGRERKREERSKQQREKDRDGGGDLSQGLEAYPGSTLGSSLDIAV